MGDKVTIINYSVGKLPGRNNQARFCHNSSILCAWVHAGLVANSQY